MILEKLIQGCSYLSYREVIGCLWPSSAALRAVLALSVVALLTSLGRGLPCL